jgi:hypothetical protein
MTSSLYAHGVNIFAEIENELIKIEAAYSRGKAVFEGEIHIYKDSDILIFKGKTDKNGKLSLKIRDLVQSESNLKIVLIAGLGHQAKWIIEKNELLEYFETNMENNDSATKADSLKSKKNDFKKHKKNIFIRILLGLFILFCFFTLLYFYKKNTLKK